MKNNNEERYVTLLKACRDLLNKCNDSCYVLKDKDESVIYDGAECDGNCLLEDINIYLEEIGE